MSQEYKIQLGIDFNDGELKNIKKQLTGLTDNTHRIRIDIDNSRLLKQVAHAKKELRGLNDLGGSKGNAPALNINTKSVESALNRVADSIDEIRSSLNTLDGKSGMQSLVSSVNQIASALGKANDESETLVKTLSALGKKDFSVNLGINMGKSNPIKSNQDFGRKVRNEILPELQKQVKAFEDYFAKQLNGKFRKGSSPLSPILTGSSVWQKHNTNIISVQQRMADNSNLEEQIKAYRQYLQIIKEAAMLKGFSESDINSVTSQFSQTADKLVKDAQDIKSGAKEAQEGVERLKGIFGASIDADALTAQLTPIVEKLEEIRVALNNLSNADSLGGLTVSFDKLSGTLETLLANAKQVQDVLGVGMSGATNVNTGITDEIKRTSEASTAAVVQNEKKKQEAYKATTDTVLYHAGIISKLNKAETNGRFYGSNRGTGYFGTGHYFVDSATKHELDDSYSYSKLPYTSIDISKYDNLFRVTSDEIGYALHSFLANLTRFTQGSDDFSIDELFGQFKNVFGDTVMDIKEFGSKLEQLKTFMSKSDFYDRSDSVSTQFMKSLGYGGVDTRGTSLADTRYGTVIYDLKEESVLQANITDELQKQGQMLEKINYERGQVFDKDTDDKIQKQLNEQIKQREIQEEFKKIYGSGDVGDAYKKLSDAQNRLQEIDGLISDYKREIDYVEDRAAKFEKEMQDFGLELTNEDIEDFEKRHIENFENSINELLQEKAKLESEIPSLEEADRKETQLVNEAYKKAEQVVEQRRLEAQQAQEAADAVIQAEERKQRSYRETSGVIESLKTTLETMKVDRSSIDTVIKDMEELGFTATDTSVKMKNGGFDMTVNGVDSIGRAITEIRHLDSATDEISLVDRKISQSFTETDKFIKQQKQAATNLKNQINQINRSAVDQNASRPIKDQSHLDSLKTKYNEITSAIQRMESASSDTFVDEQNNVKKLISEFKSLVSEYKNAENVSTKMKGTDFASGLEIAKNNLGKFKAEARDFPQIAKTINDLDTAISGIGDASSLNKFNDQLRVAKSELARIKSETSEAKQIKIDLKTGEFDNQINKIEQGAKKLSGTYKEIDGSIAKLNQALSNMKTAAAQGDVDGLIKSYKEYEATLKAVENQIDQNRMAEKESTDLTKLNQKKQSLALEMKNWLKDNSAAAKDFGARIRELQMQIDACDDSSLGNLRREFQNIKKEAQLAGKTTKTVGDRIKEQFAQYSTYLGVAEIFMWAEQGLRDMFEQVKSIDSAMTELKKVTNETDSAYSQFLSNAASRAKEIGTTIDGLVSSTADFARLGYSFKDAQGLAEVANIYAVVGDDIDSVEAATQSLISTLTAFKDEAGDLSESDFALSIVDKMNEVSNNFAISSGGIGEALQRSASSMMAANNSLDETIALITAAM